MVEDPASLFQGRCIGGGVQHGITTIESNQMNDGFGRGLNVNLVPAHATLKSRFEQVLTQIRLKCIALLLQSSPGEGAPAAGRLRSNQGIEKLQISLGDLFLDEVGNLAQSAHSGDIGVVARCEQV